MQRQWEIREMYLIAFFGIYVEQLITVGTLTYIIGFFTFIR